MDETPGYPIYGWFGFSDRVSKHNMKISALEPEQYFCELVKLWQAKALADSISALI
jgi:hypothetical protein